MLFLLLRFVTASVCIVAVYLTELLTCLCSLPFFSNVPHAKNFRALAGVGIVGQDFYPDPHRLLCESVGMCAVDTMIYVHSCQQWGYHSWFHRSLSLIPLASTVITLAIFMCIIWLSSYVYITVDETPKADVTVHSEHVLSVILYILLCPSVNCIINMTSQRGIVDQRMGASVRAHRPIGYDTCCDFPFYVPLPCYWHNPG